MPSEETSNLLSLEVWEAASLRLTVFPGKKISLQDYNWWNEIVGEMPETKTTQPKMGVEIEQGPYKNGELVLAALPDRIECRYAGNTGIVSDSPQFDTVGTFIKAIPIFSESMERWLSLEDIPSLKRVAFGAVLLNPVNSPKEGLDILSNYLPFEIDTETVSDFLYQINRRRRSELQIPNLAINRLSKWSVALLKAALIPPMALEELQFQSVWACRLELDINTVPEFTADFKRTELVPLFEELVRLGTEIVEHGDVP